MSDLSHMLNLLILTLHDTSQYCAHCVEINEMKDFSLLSKNQIISIEFNSFSLTDCRQNYELKSGANCRCNLCPAGWCCNSGYNPIKVLTKRVGRE